MGRTWAIRLTLLCCVVAGVAATLSPVGSAQAHGGDHVAVLTRSYNNSRTGANLSERILTPANVNGTTFGKIYTRSVDGQIYAQPLYVPEMMMPDGKIRNVVFVATQKNNVYAFDADDPTASTPLWQVNLGLHALSNSGEFGWRYHGGYSDIQPNVGITGTPVIDPSTGTLYVVAFVRDPNQPVATRYSHYLHALNIYTGAEKFNGPKKIQAQVAGTGEDTDPTPDGIVTFDSRFQLQRPSLLLLNGMVYIGFAGYADTDPYHGWLLGYDARTLEQRYIFCTTPDQDANNSQGNDDWDGEGGIWMSGQGPSADENGDIYFVVANGNYNANANGRNYGNSVLRVRPNNGSGTLDPQTYFTPYNYRYLNQYDLDLGITAAMLIPGTNLTLAGSKEGKLYLLDRTNMGGLNSSSNDNNARQSFLATGKLNDHIHGSPVYWESSAGTWVYLWGEQDTLRAFQFNKSTGLFQPFAAFTSAYKLNLGMPGGIVSLSANGNDPNSGIVWATTPVGDANTGTRPGVLRAYRATGPTGSTWEPLWKSDDNPGRDGLGNFAKFNPPVVADGKVFVGSFALNNDPVNSDKLVVYGLLAPSVVENPEGVPATYGDTATLSVTGNGQGPLSYQWYQGTSGDTSNPVAGATSSSFTTPRMAATTRYWARITNSYGSADSSDASVVVSRATTALSLTSSATTRVYGQAVTLTAQISGAISGMNKPSGTVTFRDGSTVVGTAPVDNGTAVLITNASNTLAVGNRQIIATYNGDSNYTQATSPAVGITVQTASTSATVSSSSTNTVFGQPIVLTAQIGVVAPGGGQPAGTVTFRDGTATLGTATLTNGMATLQINNLGVGAHQINVVYGGNSNYTAVTSGNTSITVQKASTTTTLTTSAIEVELGETVVLTADVDPVAPGAGQPSGTVTFYDGTTVLATRSLSNGTAQFTTNSLGRGSHSLSASYAGDNSFVGSSSSAVSVGVGKASTTISLTASATGLVFGQSAVFTAQITPANTTTSQPSGSVTFRAGTTVLGTADVNNGAAQFSFNAVAVGTQQITATYNGDDNFQQKVSSAVGIGVQKASTNVSASASINNPVFGQETTITAQVNVVAPGSGQPTGVVQFVSDGMQLGSAALQPDGTAQLTLSSLSVGMQDIVVTYTGDTNFLPSTAETITVNVAHLPTTIQLDVSATTVQIGESITIRAIVATTSTTTVPTGTVTFYNGDQAVGTATLDDQGQAVIILPMPTAGTYQLSAVYSGNQSYTQSRTSSVAVTVNNPPPTQYRVLVPVAQR